MKDFADRHYTGLKQIIPEVKRVILLDYDTDAGFHPEPGNEVLYEWSRKNIENYLLIPDIWKKAILEKMSLTEEDLISQGITSIVDSFFIEENLTLPSKSSWKDVKANVFRVVDGKKILFENEDSLFQRIKAKSDLIINRESLSKCMTEKEIHYDIETFFSKLECQI